ncbi:MAG: hypothetical protein AB1324_08350 [Candidatus Micrarchaeota archaeon]
MRSYFDLDTGESRKNGAATQPAPGFTVDRNELGAASMGRLCPCAFDAFAAYKPASEAKAGRPRPDSAGAAMSR